ncbi:MAG: hypothetical protein Q8J74_13175 [Candidatus Didemnitutus sp.]|nr:hypothetical protein [Candidatus Didemnitutus sp.]
MKTIPLVLCATMLFSGCASMWTRFEPFSSQRLPAKLESYEILVSPGVPINRRYEKLGVVWSSWYTYSSAEENVRKKAKEIGADAIISLRYTTYDVSINYTIGSFSTIGAYTSASLASVGTTDGYPKVAGIAIRFIDESQEEVRFTNPNIVDPTEKREPD